MSELNDIDFIINIVVAMVAGVCVGIERQVKDKNAGLKTNALVAVGAAVYVNISYQFIDISGVDISRIISQIIVGVGFLGAGVIIQGKKEYRAWQQRHPFGAVEAWGVWQLLKCIFPS